MVSPVSNATSSSLQFLKAPPPPAKSSEASESPQQDAASAASLAAAAKSQAATPPTNAVVIQSASAKNSDGTYGPKHTIKPPITVDGTSSPSDTTGSKVNIKA